MRILAAWMDALDQKDRSFDPWKTKVDLTTLACFVNCGIYDETISIGMNDI